MNKSVSLAVFLHVKLFFLLSSQFFMSGNSKYIYEEYQTEENSNSCKGLE